jgi:hypothetical protein
VGYGLYTGATERTASDVKTTIEQEELRGKQAGENQWKKVTGGLTYEQYISFVGELAENKVDLKDSEKVEAIFSKKFGDELDFSGIYNKLQNLGTRFDEIANSALSVKTAEQARVQTIAKANALMSK